MKKNHPWQKDMDNRAAKSGYRKPSEKQRKEKAAEAKGKLQYRSDLSEAAIGAIIKNSENKDRKHEN